MLQNGGKHPHPPSADIHPSSPHVDFLRLFGFWSLIFLVESIASIPKVYFVLISLKNPSECTWCDVLLLYLSLSLDHVRDTIVLCTLDGPVVTSIRALLTPPPNRELRVRSVRAFYGVV